MQYGVKNDDFYVKPVPVMNREGIFRNNSWSEA